MTTFIAKCSPAGSLIELLTEDLCLQITEKPHNKIRKIVSVGGRPVVFFSKFLTRLTIN